MESILEYLEKLRDNRVPMHMPGHKRNISKRYLKELRADLDVTETNSFDDLHNPRGVIKNSLERAEKLFNAREVFYIANGSTGAILSSIKSMTMRGDKILVTRNCHKSVYNGIELMGLNPTYIYPKLVKDEIFCASVDPEEVREKLDENEDIKLFILTSPTFEGVISDIKTIAEICHERGVLLLVDEAHGAHLGMGYCFGKSAIDLGADMCIKSLHKTLNSLTSTSILLCNNKNIDRSKIQRQINIFETTSPSYLLVASMDGLINDLIENGNETFKAWKDMCIDFREKAKNLKNLEYIDLSDKKYENVFDYDISKILISTKNTNISGGKLSTLLSDRNIDIEMPYINYIIAMTGMGETKENLDIFLDALFNIDEELEKAIEIEDNAKRYLKDFEEVIPIYMAYECENKQIKLKDSVGEVSAEYIWAYPPGIPLITPGERITESLLLYIDELLEKGINVYSDYKGLPEKIHVIDIN